MRIGNGNLEQVFIANDKSMTLSDTTMPCLAVQYSARGVANEDPTIRPHAATVAFAVGGGTLVTTVVIKKKSETGADLSDDTWTITGASAKVDWSAKAASASTIKELVDLLNEIPGIGAWALHVPWDASINNNDWVAASAAYIQSGLGIAGYTECLYRDADQFQVDSDYIAYMRVGLPEPRDRDAFKLIDIYGTCTGVTNGTLYVYRDDYAEYVAPSSFAVDMAKKEVLAEVTLAAAKSYGAGYIAATNLVVAPVVRGPLIVAAKSDDISACALKVMIKQATVNP